MLPAVAMAQALAGSTTLSSDFDPANPPKPPASLDSGAYQAIITPRYPVLPVDEYLRRKSAAAARVPVVVGPPRVVFSETPGGSMPDVLPRAPLASGPAIGFEGIPQTIFTPSDPDMAAGPEDILTVVNSSIARFDKTGQVTEILLLSTWFNQGDTLPTICPSGPFQCSLVDPTIRYDQIHGRFILTLMARDFPAQKSHILVSVSKGATYASGWKNWVLDASLDGATQTANWADFPQQGFDNQAVYIAADMFSFSANTFQYAKLRILKKSELYNPATTTLTFRDIVNLKNEDGSTAASLQPARLRGRPGVGPETGVVVNASSDAQAGYLTLWRIQDPTGNAPTAERTTILSVWNYDIPAALPQAQTSVLLDPGDARILRAVVRDNVLFLAQNAGYPAEPSTVVYTRVDLPTNKVTLQARWVGGRFFFPAFDIPATLGEENILPNQLIAGTTTTPSGIVSFAGIRNVKDGEGPFDLTTGGPARWGDYFGAGIDPVQGGLWVSGQYAKSKASNASRYGNWISYFPWSTSPAFDDVPPSNPTYNFVNVLRLWKVTSGCEVNPPRFCPTSEITRWQMAVFLIRSLYGDSFLFPDEPYFTDVPADHIAFRYVQKMRAMGITSGCSATEFCPDQPTTRRQAATFLIRAKMQNLFGDDFPFPSLPYFADVPTQAGDFKFIQKFREMGITSGCEPTQFCPDTPMTREQMAVFLIRAIFN